MARSRNIKPGFFTNEDLVELDFATRLLFAGLWTVADREGRLQDRPKKIKIDVFPADNLDIDAMLQALHDAKFIQRYEVNGSKFIQISSWDKHQNPHHTEKASEIPGPNGEITVKAPLKTRDAQKQDGGNLADSLIPDSLIPDSEKSAGKPADPPGFAEFWKTWPPTERKQAKGKCLEAWKKSGAEQDAEAVLAHVERLKDSESWKKQGGQFVPAPLVYLGQRRWDGADDDAAEGVGAGVGMAFV